MLPTDLREQRLRLHLSQAALAEALGVARNTVARWERSELAIQHPELIRMALDRLATEEHLAADKQPRSGTARHDGANRQRKDDAPQRNGGAALRDLPVEFTSFIGREQEINAVRRLLATTPVVTLSGAGGSGKTRMALQVAKQLAESFSDGVYLIELASLNVDELVAQAIATALGVRERPGRQLLQTLQDTLRTRDLLLVLDNCEHLLDAVARLVDLLLRAGTGLRILATSREPLKVAGEVTWMLAPLSYPDRSSDVAHVALERFEATRLFVERVRARRPDFVPSEADASAIVAICRRLDGLPLAIELAAARLVVLSCAQLAARLDEALPLLTTGVRTAPVRQQTLRGTIDWSHELLTLAERLVFRRLAVFAGGWSLEAAESICRDDGSATVEDNVLDVLGRLVDKSLVVCEDQAGERRFRFLETIRQYAAERLAETGEEYLIRRRHLDWCVVMAAAVCGDGSAPLNTLGTRLEQEHDNIRSALRWSIDAAEIQTGLNLATAIWQFWHLHGHYSEGIAWLSELLAHPKARGLPLQRFRANVGRGNLATVFGRYADAQAWLAESLALADELGDQHLKGGTLHFLGHLAHYRGELALARAYYEQSLRIKRESVTKLGQVTTLVQLGRMDLVAGDAIAAGAWGQEALTLARAFKYSWGEAGALQVLGRAAHNQGRLGRAQTLLDKSLIVFRQLGHPQGVGYTLSALGVLALDTGEPSRARDYLLEALTVAHHAGEPLLIAKLIEELGGLSAGRNPLRAVTLAGAAAAHRQMLGASISDPGSSPKERARMEGWLQVARRALGEPGFTAAWRAGQDLPVEEAVREAGSVQPAEVAAPARTHLSPREREVAALVAHGCTNQQIAIRLIFTEATAAKHVEHILEKLGFTSRVQIAAWHSAAFYDAVETTAS
jgi:predicted ATPase/DNA-binding CsgD family transcriptional regulator/transcriptional regulator with XRE-family HTH domain